MVLSLSLQMMRNSDNFPSQIKKHFNFAEQERFLGMMYQYSHTTFVDVTGQIDI